MIEPPRSAGSGLSDWRKGAWRVVQGQSLGTEREIETPLPPALGTPRPPSAGRSTLRGIKTC